MTEVTMTRTEFRRRFDRFKQGIAFDLVTALQLRCPVDQGILKNSIKHRIVGNHIEIFMKGYAAYVEFGTAPHIIRPKTKKALAFAKPGGQRRKHRDGSVSTVYMKDGKVAGQDKAIIVKEVNHPGTRPNPFIRTTFRSDLPRIVKQNAWRHFT